MDFTQNTTLKDLEFQPESAIVLNFQVFVYPFSHVYFSTCFSDQSLIEF